MIVPVMAISNLVLTRQIYFEQTNGAHAHYREPVPLRVSIPAHLNSVTILYQCKSDWPQQLLTYIFSFEVMA